MCHLGDGMLLIHRLSTCECVSYNQIVWARLVCYLNDAQCWNFFSLIYTSKLWLPWCILVGFHTVWHLKSSTLIPSLSPRLVYFTNSEKGWCKAWKMKTPILFFLLLLNLSPRPLLSTRGYILRRFSCLSSPNRWELHSQTRQSVPVVNGQPREEHQRVPVLHVSTVK